MNRLNIVFATIVFSVSVAGEGVVFAAQEQGNRIGFVNTGLILEQVPQAEAVRKTLQEEFSARDAKLVADQKKIKALEERMARDSLTMSDEEKVKLEREIISQRRDLKRSQDEFTEDLNIRRNEELAKMQREIAMSIVALAKENGHDLILESGVVYASERIDITKSVIERLIKDFDKKGSEKK